MTGTRRPEPAGLPLKRTVSVRTVPRWEDWSQCGRSDSSDDASATHFPERLTRLLAGLVATVERPSCNVDIRLIEGLCSSKSPLADFGSLDAFAEARCSELLKDTDEVAVKKMLRWKDLPRREPYLLSRFAWDGRLFFWNNGGSHHFAAARLLAGRLGFCLEVRGVVSDVSLRLETVRSLVDEFHVFAVPNLLMRSSWSTAVWSCPMPRPWHDDWSALFVDRHGDGTNLQNEVVEGGGVNLEATLVAAATSSPRCST